MNAALSDDNELVTSGPDQIVRHPIYASMFAMSIMSALLLGRLPWWPIGIALFVVGIEIRIHVEDDLLRNRFGSQFEEWKSQVPAYLPLIANRRSRHGHFTWLSFSSTTQRSESALPNPLKQVGGMNSGIHKAMRVSPAQ